MSLKSINSAQDLCRNIKLVSSSIVLILVLYTIAVYARSVPENTLNKGQSHSQLVSNRHRSDRLMQSTSPGYTIGNRCQQGWVWVNNKCWISTQSRRDFDHARELCRKQYNSTLPTIYSEEENEFLRQNVDLVNAPIWLNAKHNHQYRKTTWLDGTEVNYTRWDEGQPSEKSSLICIKTEDTYYMKKAEPINGQTQCVSFWADAKWGTQVGCLALLPVVCEKKLTAINRLGEGPNSSLTYQYEQQQMSPVSGGHSLSKNRELMWFNLFAAITTIISSANHLNDYKPRKP